jgi:transcriptional regulator with XRE-family HTH domain
MDKKSIILKLAQIRVAKCLSQYELSLRIGKSQCYIHEVEKGKSNLTLEAFLAICDALEVNPKDLF